LTAQANPRLSRKSKIAKLGPITWPLLIFTWPMILYPPLRARKRSTYLRGFELVNRTVVLPDKLYAKLNLLAGAFSMSTAELIRAALVATVDTVGENDRLLGAGFHLIDIDMPPEMPANVDL
jgi:hypothetical protein